MKKIILYILGLFLLATSCYKEKLDENPDTSVKFYKLVNGEKVYSPNPIYTQSPVVFEASNDAADYLVLYPGELPSNKFSNSVYTKQIPGADSTQTANTVGTRATGKLFAEVPLSDLVAVEHSFSEPGRYPVTVVATNVKNHGNDVATKVDSSVFVEVIDTLPFFNGDVKLYKKAAQSYVTSSDAKGNVTIQYIVKNGTSFNNVQFDFSLYSRQTTVTVDGKQIKSGEKLDFTTPKVFTLTTGSGFSKTTTVIVLEAPAG